MRMVLLFTFVLALLELKSQPDSVELQESTQTIMKLEEFIAIVLANHPVVKQGELQNLFADAELRTAKGGFDPKITAAYDLKNFKEKEYYNMLNATLKVPTWFPVDPKITFDRNTGEFLDESISIPNENQNRQFSAGLSLPIGKGLFIDERRMALQQARIYRDITEAEQIKIINKILLQSIKDYLEWNLAYQEVLLLEQSIEIASELFDRIVIDFNFGEAAVVDTVQAMITYQSRIADYEQVKFDFVKSRLAMSVHIWSEDLTPLELQESTIPDTLTAFGGIPDTETIENMIDWALINHPEIQKLNAKINQLEVENRWNRESLKPQIDLSYSFIDAPLTPVGEFESPSFNDNYKLGIDFSFPIFLRKERGKLQKTTLKIQENNLEVNRAKQNIKNSILTKRAE
ncbi:MAG: TolC family protein, partial [Cyclobacteriaceae bacterium]|nr:TolC family protein [Cyclobacteriaceae bacterium HetDA_MAG_MS6]